MIENFSLPEVIIFDIPYHRMFFVFGISLTEPRKGPANLNITLYNTIEGTGLKAGYIEV